MQKSYFVLFISHIINLMYFSVHQKNLQSFLSSGFVKFYLLIIAFFDYLFSCHFLLESFSVILPFELKTCPFTLLFRLFLCFISFRYRPKVKGYKQFFSSSENHFR